MLGHWGRTPDATFAAGERKARLEAKAAKRVENHVNDDDGQLHLQ